MFMKKAFAAVLATAVLVAGAVEAKDLRVASNTTFPPFEFVNTKTQEITGFEMDLIRAMGKQAGYEVKITNMAFDGIIPAVLSGSVDVGASGFSVTEERKKRVLFTEPFYKSGLTVLVAKGNEDKIQGFKDLDGRKLAVQIGTTAAAKAKDIKDAKVQTFNNAGDAILELANGGCAPCQEGRAPARYALRRRLRHGRRQGSSRTRRRTQRGPQGPQGKRRIRQAHDEVVRQGEVRRVNRTILSCGASLYMRRPAKPVVPRRRPALSVSGSDGGLFPKRLCGG